MQQHSCVQNLSHSRQATFEDISTYDAALIARMTARLLVIESVKAVEGCNLPLASFETQRAYWSGIGSKSTDHGYLWEAGY